MSEQNLFPVSINVQLSPETVELIRTVAAYEIVSVKITDAAAYEQAANQMKEVKGWAKDIDEQRKVLTKPIDEKKKEIMDFFNAPLDVCRKIETAIKAEMINYQEEQERQRRLQAAAAEEAARKEREKLEAQAEKAAEKGKEEKAEALKENAATVVAVQVAEAAPQVKGIVTKTVYSAQVDSFPELAMAVAAKHFFAATGGDAEKLKELVMKHMMAQVPDNALTPDMKFLNTQAKALKENFNYAGCSAVAEKSIASRSA